MKNKFFWFGIVSSVLMVLSSCETKKTGDDLRSGDIGDVAVITDIDSMAVDYLDRLTFIDYTGELDLFLFLSSTQELVFVDANGNVENVLNLLGDSPDKCGRKINHVTFDKEGNLVVASDRAFNFYNLKGEKVREDIRPDFKMIYSTYYKNMELFEINGNRMAVISPQMNYLEIDYSNFAPANVKEYLTKYRFRSIYDLDNNRVHSRAIANEEGSIFLEFDYRYRDEGHRKFFDKESSTYYIINNPDHVLYKYKMGEDGIYLDERIKLIPDHFRYVKKYHLTDFSSESIDDALKYNSNYLSLVVSEDRIYIQYRKGVPEKPEQISIQEAIAQSENYLMVLDKKGRKIGEDILLPHDFRKLFFVDKDEKLFFYPKRERSDKELFYKVALELKEES